VDELALFHDEVLFLDERELPHEVFGIEDRVVSAVDTATSKNVSLGCLVRIFNQIDWIERGLILRLYQLHNLTERHHPRPSSSSGQYNLALCCFKALDPHFWEHFLFFDVIKNIKYDDHDRSLEATTPATVITSLEDGFHLVDLRCWSCDHTSDI
jgi:hypothetical protein